jgi:uncharacterized protein YaaW (UPF0174 family)
MDELKALLDKSLLEERIGLAKILGTNSSTSQGLIDQLRWNYQPWWSSLFGCEPGYREIIEHVAQHLRVPHYDKRSILDLEIEIAQKVLQMIWEKMTPEQRRKMEDELRKAAQKYDKTGSFASGASMFALLTAARLSGFGVYLLASTSLGALTSTLGITLPFAVYTTMSSAIAVIVGPVGWISAAVIALWSSGKSNKNRLTSAIVYICMLRSKGFLTGSPFVPSPKDLPPGSTSEPLSPN